jgi:hypothetical protein
MSWLLNGESECRERASSADGPVWFQARAKQAVVAQLSARDGRSTLRMER